jgi:hypothetical protein
MVVGHLCVHPQPSAHQPSALNPELQSAPDHICARTARTAPQRCVANAPAWIHRRLRQDATRLQREPSAVATGRNALRCGPAGSARRAAGRRIARRRRRRSRRSCPTLHSPAAALCCSAAHKHVPTQYNTLQRSATRCNLVQHVATQPEGPKCAAGPRVQLSGNGPKWERA